MADRLNITALKIGANRYTVVEVDGHELDDDGKWAEIQYRRCVIRHQADRPAFAKVEAVMHEIIHALIRDSGAEVDTDTEEAVVRLLSPRLTAFLADNPEAVREMLRALLK